MYLLEGLKLKFNTLSKYIENYKIIQKLTCTETHCCLDRIYLAFLRRLMWIIKNALLWNCWNSLPASKIAVTVSFHRERTSGPKPKWRTDPDDWVWGPGWSSWWQRSGSWKLNRNIIVPPRIEVKHSSEKYTKAQKRECPKILSTTVVLSQVYLAISLV